VYYSGMFDKLNDESRLMQERFSKQSGSTTADATVDVVNQMLNVIDTYERAFQAVEPSTPEQEQIVSDYKATYDKILDCFVQLNVTKVETVGAEFDYELHQAMMQMPSDEFEEGVVCQEFAPGWVCGDRLIRPAMVAVAA
jgi:molecular chaperone GrpE